jgi:hypothetical protein
MVFLTAVAFFLAMEQRINTKFYFKWVKSQTKFLQTVCGDETSNLSKVFEWFKPFKVWGENFKDDPLEMQPQSQMSVK